MFDSIKKKLFWQVTFDLKDPQNITLPPNGSKVDGLSMSGWEQCRLKDLLESLANGVLMFNRNEEVISYNSLIEMFTHLKEDQITLENVIKYFDQAQVVADHEKEKIDMNLAIKKALAAQSSWFGEVQLEDKYFELFVNPVRNHEDKIFGGAIVFHDITRKKKAEIELLESQKQLREMDKLKADFIALAAHQLRTPLGSMRWNIEMLLSGDLGDIKVEAKEALMQIYQATQRLIILVGDLVTVSKINQNEAVDNPKPIAIAEVIKDVINEIGFNNRYKSVVIDLQAEEDVPEINIDPKKFRDVIQNLLSNAVKYNRPDGKVTAKIEKEGESIKMSIIDNGMGIPKGDQDKIFTKFYRADNAVRSDVEGSGLGLFVVKSYIESWGGKIWFESKEGEGTTFFVNIPLEPKLEVAENKQTTPN